MTLIDLGVPGEFQLEQPPLPRWARKLGVPVGRKVAAFLAVAVLAGGFAGSAPATMSEPLLRRIPALDLRNSFLMIDDILVQLRRSVRTVSAVDLASGRTLWSMVVSEDVSRLETFDGATLVMQVASGVGSSTDDDPETFFRNLAAGRLTALDPRTGAELWHHSGALLSLEGIRSLILLTPGAPGTGGASGASGLDGADDGWRIVRVDERDGHDLWSVPAPQGTQWTFTYTDDVTPVDGGLVLMRHDGTVISVDAGGRQTHRGRIEPGVVLEWAWSSYLGVSRGLGVPAPTDGRELRYFELHDLRTLTPRPMWGTIDDPAEDAPWPCGSATRLCQTRKAVDVEIDARTGTLLRVLEDSQPQFFSGPPGMVGIWSLLDSWNGAGDWLVQVSPSVSKTGVGWLGVARMDGSTPRITPLMPLPMLTTSCWSGSSEWVICNTLEADGSASDRSFAIRRSEVDALVRQLR